MNDETPRSDERFKSLIRDGEWLDAQTFPALGWAVPGLIPEGFGLLIGPPKAGKSWAALSTALAVANGGKAFASVPVGPPRNVLYLALEDGDRRLQERCRLLLAGEPIPARLDYATRATPVEAVSLIQWWLTEHGGNKPLVLLDTLGKVSPPSNPGESAYGRDYRIGGTLKRLADDSIGSTLLAVHHDRKAGSEDFVDSVSGTHGLAGSADFIIVLDRRRQEDDGVLKVTGRDVMEAEYAMTLSSKGQWTLKGNDLAEAAANATTVKATAGLGDRSAEVVRFAAKHAEGIRAADVADELDISKDAAGTYLQRLDKAGRINKAGRGLYTPVLSVPSVLFNDENNTPKEHKAQTEHTVGRTPTCTVCKFPMNADLADAGQTTHPTCEPAS